MPYSPHFLIHKFQCLWQVVPHGTSSNLPIVLTQVFSWANLGKNICNSSCHEVLNVQLIRWLDYSISNMVIFNAFSDVLWVNIIPLRNMANPWGWVAIRKLNQFPLYWFTFQMCSPPLIHNTSDIDHNKNETNIWLFISLKKNHENIF